MLGRLVKSGVTSVGSTMCRMPVRNSGLYPPYYKHLVAAPRETIGFTEKAFWGVFFFVGIMAVPAWILVNLDDYKGKKSNQ